ncbi:hypothetical protein ACFV3E_40930 [Streptomyces sp. NPDC059718]
MIPAGRTAVFSDGIAELADRKALTPAFASQLPDPISRPGARTRYWDKAQIRAHLAGKDIPTLPAVESPKDLLDREEAREELVKLGVTLKPEAWRSYINNGYAPKADRTIEGVPHWYRSTIHAWPASRPGERAGAGRPKGSKESTPRTPATDARLARAQERLERVRAMVKATPDIKAAQIAEVENISERQAHRLLAQLNG